MDILPAAVLAGPPASGLAPVAPAGAEAAFAAMLGELLAPPAKDAPDPSPRQMRGEPAAAAAPAGMPAPALLPTLAPVGRQPVATALPAAAPVAADPPPPDVAALAVPAVAMAAEAIQVLPPAPPAKPSGLPRPAKTKLDEAEVAAVEPARLPPERRDMAAVPLALPIPAVPMPVPAPPPPGSTPVPVAAARTTAPAGAAAAVPVPAADVPPPDAPAAAPPTPASPVPAAAADAPEPPRQEAPSAPGDTPRAAPPEPVAAPLPEAPPPPASPRETAGPIRPSETGRPAVLHPRHQLEAAVTAVLQRGPAATQTVIRLNPAELGAVQIRVERPKAGGAEVTLTVERPETLLMLLRDREGLAQALDRAGVPADSRVITYQAAAPATPIDAPRPEPDQTQPKFAGQGGGFSGSQSGQGQGGHAAPERPDAPRPDPPPETTWSALADRVDITA
jgi:hypothetical protein